MIKLTKNNGREYIVINTEIQAGESIAPVMMQINLKDVSEEDKYKMYQTASLLLNRVIKRYTPQPKVKKPWYKFW
jgi:flagella basal body P-ring formation protein FlgA